MYCLWLLPHLLLVCTTLVYVHYLSMYTVCGRVTHVLLLLGVAVLAFAYCSGYHCYSYYLSEVHVYCLSPLPHILLVCPFSVDPY